jgi:drug/metabolite transporter (DMT)-like permease
LRRDASRTITAVMTRSRATLVGFTAVLLWSLLALLTVGTVPVPPLQLNAMCFAIGGLVGLVWVVTTGGGAALRAVPLRVYAFGTAGLFGYHLLYFSALRLAPAAEASLIAYLWPLLIVLLSGLLPGEQLHRAHVFGALLAFAGAALLVLARLSAPEAGALPGYGLAFLCAVTWAVYSVGSRRFGTIPTASVAVFCLATAAFSGLAHLALEETVWPTGTYGWTSLALLGAGPVGLAFYVWDVGVKHGDIQILGVASYAAPLLSTLVLVAAGKAPASTRLAIAAMLITAGAALAAWASAGRRD